MRTILIEDELPAQKELERMLKILRPATTVVGRAETITEACQVLADTEADLVFMDIQLADGPSFEIFSRCAFAAPVIFVTAYDAYAIQAFKVNSIDYLLKPVEPELLEAALAKFDRQQLDRRQQAEPEPGASMGLTPEVLRGLLSPQQAGYKTRFVTQMGDRIRFITETDTAYFLSEDEVTFLVSVDGRRHILNQTLEQLEHQLDPTRFYRINRQYIVNLKAIGEIHRYFNGRLKLHLQPVPKEEIMVSRARVSGFMAWLEG